MAVIVQTAKPAALLRKIRAGIDSGHIRTWSYDRDGDFTHSPDQWSARAWFKPMIQSGCLAFGLLGRDSTLMTNEVYGVYHGRFIEMLLTHFDVDFRDARATALGDTILDSFKGTVAAPSLFQAMNG